MNTPKLEMRLRAATTVNDLKAAITDILDEYNFDILSTLEERISKLEDD